MCFSVLVVARPVEDRETMAEVASNEKAVGDGQHPGPGTFFSSFFAFVWLHVFQTKIFFLTLLFIFLALLALLALFGKKVFFVTCPMWSILCHVSGHTSHVTCQVSSHMSHLSADPCHLQSATCHLSLMPTATATCPFAANYPIIHSSLVH